MRARALAVALVALASAAGAEEAILSIEFGPDRLDFAPGQIRSVEVVLNDMVPYVAVTLSDDLQFALASMTLVHVGQIGAIRVCGRVVSEPMLQSALTTPSFVISNSDVAETRRLAAILQARDCSKGATS